MNYRFLSILLILCSWASQARAESRYIVRTSGGAVLLQSLCKLLGCSVLRSIGDPVSQLFVVTTSNLTSPVSLLSALLHQVGITAVELDLPISVVPGTLFISKHVEAPEGLTDKRPVQFYGSTVWNGYATQPAAHVIRLQDAQSAFRAQGSGIVSVIDTGIDPNHPALSQIVVPGYDFTRDESGFAAETADLNQSTAAVVDGGPMQVNASTIAVLDQSTAAVVDNPGYAAFGHGTMVAGIVHLTAPRANIMPLKTFGANGIGYTSDILRAIYFAVQAGARIIQMSFSMPDYSQELKNAIGYAVSRQLTCVASAGNDGKNTMVYPAGLNNVMGVGSTDLFDKRSSFSNYGNNLVWVAAPGEGIISTYPMGTYAAGWGTSFSAPFVSGSAALLLQLQPGTNESTASAAVANAKPVGQGLGKGRLDAYRALASGKSKP